MVNLKEKIDNNTDKTNPRLFGSLIYLANTKIYSCHTINGPSHFMIQTEIDSLDIENHVFTRHSGIWPKICL
jgi:hypothetical protein